MKILKILAWPALLAGAFALGSAQAGAGSMEADDAATPFAEGQVLELSQQTLDLRTAEGAEFTGMQLASGCTPGFPGCTFPPIPALDHFLCYNVVSPTTGLNIPVNLRDQFGLTPARVGRPLFLCNPTEKQAPGFEPSWIVNPEDHLVCYLLEINQTQFGAVQIFNQFGPQKLGIRDARLLCVPSQKQVIFLRPDRRPR